MDHCFPEGPDFFINLSSFLGDTGNVGQAIYAGTAVSDRLVVLQLLALWLTSSKAFYDGFTQYRDARGQHTVSIALRVVLHVGYVA